MNDCGCEHDEFAAVATKTDEELDTPGPDPRGDMVTTWGPDLIAPYAKPTGDGRRFKVGALSNRELPLPLKWQREDTEGHKKSVVVGTLDGITYTDEGVMGYGIMLDPDPALLPRLAEDVAEARLLLEKKVIGPSVDIDDMEYHPLGEMASNGHPEVEVTRGRISAATLVQIPAFAEARPFTLRQVPAEEYAARETAVTASGVRTDLSTLPVAPSAAWDPLAWLMGHSTQGALYDDDAMALFPVAQPVNGTFSLVPAAVADAISVLAFRGDEVKLGEGVKTALRAQLEELAAVCELPVPPWAKGEALVASAGLPKPVPAELFANPKFSGPTPLRLERVGEHIRVTGHLADWKTCHTGFAGSCVRAPRSRSNYAYFHVTPYPTTDGEVLTGKITLGGGHADTRLGFHAAAEHYDTTTTAAADVRVGEDKHGIWVSGVVRPYLGERELHELALAPLSGDWRPIGGSRELIAALAVNAPGFPVLQASVVGGREGALVAAGVVHREPDDDERVKADLMGKKKRKRMMRDMDEDDEMYAAEEVEYFASLDQEARMAAAKKGQANADGSYPIRNVDELEKAIQAFGRAKNKAATKRLIMRRARELKRPDLIPEGWLKEREQVGAASLAREASAFDLAVTIEEDFSALRRLDAARLAEVF